MLVLCLEVGLRLGLFCRSELASFYASKNAYLLKGGGLLPGSVMHAEIPSAVLCLNSMIP